MCAKYTYHVRQCNDGSDLQDEIKPTLWEALGGARDVPLTTVGLLLALICQADFVAKTSFVFWLLDKYVTLQHDALQVRYAVHMCVHLNYHSVPSPPLQQNLTCSKAFAFASH